MTYLPFGHSAEMRRRYIVPDNRLSQVHDGLLRVERSTLYGLPNRSHDPPLMYSDTSVGGRGFKL